jgi:hypothetical protein
MKFNVYIIDKNGKHALYRTTETEQEAVALVQLLRRTAGGYYAPEAK